MASSLHQQQAAPQPRRTMEHRLPHRTPRAEGSPSPYRLRHSSDGRNNKELHLSRAAAAERSSDMSTTKSAVFSGGMIINNEKETLHGLNDRFAGFIEKVRHLERQNELLESEIREMKERRRSPGSLEEEHGAGLAELRRLLRDLTGQKHGVEVEHQSLEEEMDRLAGRYERETRGREDAEGGMAALKRDMDDASQAKVQLDKKAQSLVDEMDFLKKSHEAEVSRMVAQVQQVNVGAAAHHHVDFGKADLTAALRDIRAQLEGHAASDLQQVDEGFRAQFAKLTEAAESKREALRAGQQEVQEVRRSLQARSIEMDCNRGTRDALERQLQEVEDRHNDDILHYQDTIKELENELISAKFDMSAHLREYQDLLNVKMELDVEILSYRKLLEGEETRLSTISGAPVVSMPYIYRQSPVYTLPCLSRPGGPGRRAEPQYKFVEEIITETTREIEMSEFEESGSDEEAGCADKAERKSREEEEEVEDNQSDEHSPDRDGEQASDSQQDLVESAQRSEQGDDHKVEGGSAMDKAEVEPTVQKDAAAKAADSKIEESEEVKMTESEVDKKVSALKESEESDVKALTQHIDTAQAKMLKDESSAKCPTDSGNVQVSSIVDKLQGEAPSLPTETMEKITVALSVPLPKDTLQPEKQNKEKTPSVVPRGEEKEDRITESMAACNKADTAKSPIGHKVAKSIEKAADDADKEKDKSGDKTHTVEPIFPKEKMAVTEEYIDTKQGLPDSSKTQEPSIAINDTDLGKDKHTATKSGTTEPPKGEGEKPNTGDNTQTVDATSPKGNIALTAETKDPQEGAPDNSRTQKPSHGKLEDKKSDSEDKTNTVEPISPKEKIAVTEESKDTKQGLPDGSKTQEPSIAVDDSSDLDKDKRTVAKSDMAEPSKLEGEKSTSEDKTQTVEPIFPKGKIAVTEENKDTKQPDGSKSQEPSKVPEKINNAKEKEEKLKDSAKNVDSGKTTENITEPIEISETKTPSQKEPGTSTASVTAKTVGGLMSEAAKPKTENGFSNGIGGIKAEDNEPIKAVPQGEAAKEKTNTSI